MFERLCEPEHLGIIILALSIALVLMGAGRGLGKLIGPILNKFLGREQISLTVKTGGEMPENSVRMPVKGAVCDPEKCAPLQRIKSQQERNVGDIERLNTGVHDLTELFFRKLTFIQTQNAVMLRAMVKNNQLLEADIPKEVI